MRTLVEFLDDVLVEACAPDDRASLEAEVTCLVHRHVGSCEPAQLRYAAHLLEAHSADNSGRARMKLWAAVLRRRARHGP
jgi:hypothetical protein